MDFSVKIEGLPALAQNSERIKQNIADEVNKAVFASAQKVASDAKRSITSGQKSGRTYRRRTVTHQASAPGEAPASDTGRLVNDINAYLKGGGEAFTVAGRGTVVYARMLEFGTRLMAARPFFFPALEKNKAWIRDRIQDAVRRGLTK
ncbi:HK97-gp10 family putative phage morphogenesis protein [Tundrisphaera lichenicola]|uniref:HK97-gp10 family putative phage morphogenesis protein n=1 Tax=Tundrisphaera lichenicola TaxID=2029860 RepID=UPI003EB91502